VAASRRQIVRLAQWRLIPEPMRLDQRQDLPDALIQTARRVTDRGHH
jgi:hypothetical protein